MHGQQKVKKKKHSCCFCGHYAMTLVVFVLLLLLLLLVVVVVVVVVEPSRLVQNYVLEFYTTGTRFRYPRGRWEPNLRFYMLYLSCSW